MERKIAVFNQLMDQDQTHKKELAQLRKQEIAMLSEDVDKFFKEEQEQREKQEVEMAQMINGRFEELVE